MMELVTGGSGSGKSAYAEETLCRLYPFSAGVDDKEKRGMADVHRYYIATMLPWDKETEKKIERHRAMRSGRRFQTLEWYTDLEGKLKSKKSPPMENADVLLECVSNLTANEMYEEKKRDAAGVVLRGIVSLKERCRNLIVVTNDVFSESLEASSEMQLYKKTLGKINCALADTADRVTEVVCGIPCAVKDLSVLRSEKFGRQGKNISAVDGREYKCPADEKKGGRGLRIITGGTLQGKLSFAKQMYPGEKWTDGKTCRLEEVQSCRAMNHFHEFIKRWLEQGKGWKELADLILEKNGNLILVCDEVGCGLVPVDTFERKYRESVGRIMCSLAGQAERVDRVVCGIGMRIK